MGRGHHGESGLAHREGIGKGLLASPHWHLMICVGPALGCATLQEVSWIRFNSCWGTYPLNRLVRASHTSCDSLQDRPAPSQLRHGTDPQRKASPSSALDGMVAEE
jgi:hypothetical protein